MAHEERIIGEGYHMLYGQAHAEVNCINSVNAADHPLLKSATLYVSLEPCAHYGKTPPCADLIIKTNIPNVVIGCRDSFKEVSGKGIQKMQNAGVNIITGVLESEALELNKRFFTFHNQRRPYIILKWAQSVNGMVAANTAERTMITNEKTNCLVHKWRSEESAILVGTNTALLDNPSLTVRHWPGKNPTRLVVDKELKLPTHLRLFDETVPTIVFNNTKTQEGKLAYQRLSPGSDYLPQLLQRLYEQNILSVLVEGGTKTLQSFIDEGQWDEARIITNNECYIDDGKQAPTLRSCRQHDSEEILTDTIRYYQHI